MGLNPTWVMLLSRSDLGMLEHAYGFDKPEPDTFLGLRSLNSLDLGIGYEPIGFLLVPFAFYINISYT